MKYRKFSEVEGDTPFQKLSTLLKESADNRLLVQKKWNGVQFVINRGRYFTRQNKEYNANLLPKYLRSLGNLSRIHNLIFHGELISFDLPFEELCGQVSVNRVEAPDWGRIHYVVFDFIDLNAPGEWYEARIHQADKYISKIEKASIAMSLPVNNPASADAWYYALINQKAEGCIYRLAPCIYDPSLTIHPDIVKRKALKSAEGECLAVREGTGKRKGMLGSMLVLWNGVHINIGGGVGLTDAYLTKLFHHPPIGKLITFTYEDLSAAGTPLRPQIVTVRDYE